MTARSSVMPCDLWMVIAHAQRNGTCLTVASTVSPSCICQEFGFMVTMLPFSNSTIGQPPCDCVANPRTVPSDPLTYWWSVSLRTAITAAPVLRHNRSGASMFFLSRSTRFAAPSDSARYSCGSSLISNRRRSLSASACLLTGNRFTACCPGSGMAPNRVSSTLRSPSSTAPSRMSVSTFNSWPSS